jgi:2-keto-3-deoxy-L-rhamnonate aldolase RhmA
VDKNLSRSLATVKPKEADAAMENFRQGVRDGRVLIGAFVKTGSHQVVEVLGAAGLDFAVIDAEHAPFDAATLDRMALAGRAAGLSTLVRVPELAASPIGQSLDLGFAGVVVPHVTSAEEANGALAAAKYEGRQRGFSPSTRAGGYGTRDAAAYRAAADRESSVWAQIEDEAALDRLDEIAAVGEVDCLFLGRADLAVSLDVDGPRHPRVAAAVKATTEAGKRHGRTVGIFITDIAEVPDLLALGITIFVCGTDQSYMLAEGRRLKKALFATLANQA